MSPWQFLLVFILVNNYQINLQNKFIVYMFIKVSSRYTYNTHYICKMYMHEVLVNRLGGLSLPRKSVVRCN